MPFFQDAPRAVLDSVYVQVEVQTGERHRSHPASIDCGPEHLPGLARAPQSGPLQFRDLLALPFEESSEDCDTLNTGRWAIVGEPGAGKTTAARHLTWELAGEPTGPVPVYLSLSRWAASNKHPFELAEADLESARGAAESEGLAEQLKALAREPGRVWLLLDGLDEVHPNHATRARERLRDLAGNTDCAGLVLVVLSRPGVLEDRDLGVHFRSARVQALTPLKQKRLLEKLVPEHAARLWGEIGERPALGDLAKNPLMLSLMAMLGRGTAEDGAPLPVNRVRLYQEAVRLLLVRGHYPDARGMEAAEDARFILSILSHDLQEQGGESWSRQVIAERLLALRAEEASHCRQLGVALRDGWSSSGAFLDNVAKDSGILGPHDGPYESWRYLHRSLREFLAAEHLRRLGPKTIQRQLAESWHAIREQYQDTPWEAGEPIAQQVGRWGEVHALVCGLLEEPRELLEALRESAPELVRRALPSVETLSAPESLGLLLQTKGATPDDLQTLTRSWPLSPGQRSEVLHAAITSETSTEHLGWLLHTLEALELPLDAERFFRACGRWGDDPLAAFSKVSTRDGEVPLWRSVAPCPDGFWMGSPEKEEERRENEVRHRVSLSVGFEVMVVPVTCGMFAAFEPDHRPRAFEGISPEEQRHHPVQAVSWFQAVTFCRWLTANSQGQWTYALPTEAEWEYACRAGTKTPFNHPGIAWPLKTDAAATDGRSRPRGGSGGSGSEPSSGGATSGGATAGNSLAEVAWYDDVSERRTHTVGELLPNDWGLFDMHGNVW